MKTFFQTLILFFVSVAIPGIAIAQEYQFFSGVRQAATGTIGWDSFSVNDPGNYAGPHLADMFESGSTGSVLSVTAGGFKAGPNLYAFLSTPTWSLNLNGLVDTDSFTSIGLQVATTPPPAGADINFSSFLLDGLNPDEFISMGSRTSLNAGGGQPPQDVNYYWAAWNNLAAIDSYELTIGPGQNHAVFTAARVDYLNSAIQQNISVVPEPSLAVALGLGGIMFFVRRQRVG